MSDVSIALNAARDMAGCEVVAVKLSTPTWEFNLRATEDELAGLRRIREAKWLGRHCLHIGRSADTPVHWASEGETATILVGHDEETWDIALAIPITVVDAIVAEAAGNTWRLG